MASLSVKEAQGGYPTDPSTTSGQTLSSQEPAVNHSILLIPDTSLQRLTVELVRSDKDAAVKARQDRTYGYNGKGDSLTHEQWLKELTDLYFGQRLPKTTPWKFCSNRSLMIGMAILEVMHARLLPAVYNEELTRWRPTRPLDEAQAERVEAFMFWWVRVWVKMREFFDRWARTAIAYGRVMTVTSWDIRTLETGQMTEAQHQLNPDGSLTITPGTAQTQTIEKSRSDIIPEQDIFLLPGATDVQRDVVLIRRQYLYRDLVDLERTGNAINITLPSKPDLISLKDLLPPVALTNSSAMTPEELERLKDVQRRNIPVECFEWWGPMDVDGDGHPETVRMLVDLEHSLFFGGLPLAALSSRGLRPLDLTLYLPRLDDPHGLNGLGVLEQVKELALEIDAIFNQLTDANTLSVMRPGFYDPSGDVDAPAIQLAPNKMTAVTNPSQAVYFPEFNIRTEQLINAIRVVMEFIERLTAASAYVMGKESEIVGGSGTATRTQAIVGASNQRHAIPVLRLRDGAARIMTQHLDAVQTHLPPGFEQRVMKDGGEPMFSEANPLTQKSLSAEMEAYLLPDESMGSKETERQLADIIYQMLIQNVLVATDPAKLYKITADVLKARGKDPKTYLGPEPPIAQARTPQEEHGLMLSGAFGQVRAAVTDNHLEHLMAHQALPQTVEFQSMALEDQSLLGQYLQQHMQEHLQLMAAVLQQKVQSGGTTQNANGQSARGSAGRPQSSQPVGPEPGVGSPGQPLAAAQAASRNGESHPAA